MRLLPPPDKLGVVKRHLRWLPAMLALLLAKQVAAVPLVAIALWLSLRDRGAPARSFEA